MPKTPRADKHLRRPVSGQPRTPSVTSNFH
jgi:hypothetical protein